MSRGSALIASVNGSVANVVGAHKNESSYANGAADLYRTREQRRNTSKRCLHVLRAATELQRRCAFVAGLKQPQKVHATRLQRHCS